MGDQQQPHMSSGVNMPLRKFFIPVLAIAFLLAPPICNANPDPDGDLVFPLSLQILPTTTGVCAGEEVLVAAEGESCTDACAAAGKECTVEALDHLDMMTDSAAKLIAMFDA